MDTFLIILGAICLLIGLIGSIVPVLPGAPLSYLGLLLLHWTDKVQFSWQFLTIWAVIVIVIQVLDAVIPIWGTKKFGGTKWGVWGSTIGLLVGLFLGPVGIIFGPFVGAVIGELLYFNRHPQTTSTNTTPPLHNTTPPLHNTTPRSSNFNKALRAGFGSFIGLLTGTFLKILCCSMMIVYFVKELI